MKAAITLTSTIRVSRLQTSDTMLKSDRARFKIQIISVERLNNGKEVEVEWFRSRKQRGGTVSTTVRDGEARWKDEWLSVETKMRTSLPKRSGFFAHKNISLRLLDCTKQPKFLFITKPQVIAKVTLTEFEFTCS